MMKCIVEGAKRDLHWRAEAWLEGYRELPSSMSRAQLERDLVQALEYAEESSREHYAIDAGNCPRCGAGLRARASFFQDHATGMPGIVRWWTYQCSARPCCEWFIERAEREDGDAFAATLPAIAFPPSREQLITRLLS